MEAPRKFKEAFMEHLLLSLQVASINAKAMDLRERREAVKLSSDVAMASARGGHRAARWPRALVARHAAERRNEALLRRIMGSRYYEAAAAAASKKERSKRVVRRSSQHRRKKRMTSLVHHGVSAGAMVKGRVQVLRRLVPGGQGLHGFSSLLSEALDYVVCLKAQVELMQCLCNGSQC